MVGGWAGSRFILVGNEWLSWYVAKVLIVLMIQGALDNLLKGAATQCMQVW